MSNWQFSVNLLAINYGILTTYDGVSAEIIIKITIIPHNSNHTPLPDYIIVQGISFFSHWSVKPHLALTLMDRYSQCIVLEIGDFLLFWGGYTSTDDTQLLIGNVGNIIDIQGLLHRQMYC